MILQRITSSEPAEHAVICFTGVALLHGLVDAGRLGPMPSKDPHGTRLVLCVVEISDPIGDFFPASPDHDDNDDMYHTNRNNSIEISTWLINCICIYLLQPDV